ncbi:di-tripeptide ABC transporter [Neocallimastix lanati (nom. inval.)]|uniref:Di-tripeptide ABC transporter n=1 Tax=Neocallimastix californiae TaxID=1754190 RepID=A0A1Y2F0S4_9FUNG|nr:di-tripeptide ABC transporter [Neocallimastix sp. JGI-2020a]ORY77443.1 di-tripeptide ABC transporter [Neocallimastix californiae]|eukprot:ORY77443.1 di-tripeptide ABC transporter [Neocallimastix californiae]
MREKVIKKGHPKGLYLLFITEMAERFSYYGMRGIFILYLMSALYDENAAYSIYGTYTGLAYLTPVLGGWISDRYWGNRKSIIIGGILMALGQFFMYGSARFIKKSIHYERPMVIDPNVNNTFSNILLYVGLFLLIMGNGLFKPNISTMLGDLYEATDTRKDSAFTIFYMGINVGAFIAPFVCSTVSPKVNGYLNPGGYRWGFFCAGIGMILSIIVFTLFKNKLLVTPDGLQVGLTPDKDQVKARQKEQVELLEKTLEQENGKEGEEKNKLKKNSPIRLIINLVLAVVIFFLYMWLLAEDKEGEKNSKWKDFNEYISAIIYVCTISLPLFIITDKNLNHTQKSRIGVIYIIALFVIFFWAAYEQAGSSLTVFADQQIDRHICDWNISICKWEFPAAWFQSVNPVTIVILAPITALIWEFLGKRNLEPFSPAKQAIGLILLAIGYNVIAIGTQGVGDTDKVSYWWLVSLYVIHTVGELCLSPIGLSMVNKLSPAHLSSLLMGVWFMSNAASNVFSAKLAKFKPSKQKGIKNVLGFEIDTLTKFFSVFVIMGALSGIILLGFCPLLKRMMKGIQ